MAGRDYTTTGLIESIKRRAQIPINQSTFTAAKVLAYADDEMTDTVIPMVRKHRNDHFVTYEDVTTTAATAYDIPEEAMNRGLFNVGMLDGQGNPYALIPINFDRELDIDTYWGSVIARSGGSARRGYYVRGDQVHLYPDSVADETLRLYYERLQGKLIETSAAGLVTGVDSGTGVVTCSGGVPSSISTSTPIDCINARPGFGLRFSAVTPSAKAATTVTIAAASAALVVVGDYIALEGESPIVQLPVEAHAKLAQAVAVKLKEALGHPGAVLAQEKLDRAEQNYGESFQTRVEQAPKRVFARNRLSDFVRH